MAYKKNELSGIEYDQDIDTIRWGTYTINPTELGLKRNKQVIDPATLKSMDDVYKAFGADAKVLQKREMYNSISGTFMGHQKPEVFSGKDAWKNQAAETLWAMVNHDAGKGSLYKQAPVTSLDSRSPDFKKVLGMLTGSGQRNMSGMNLPDLSSQSDYRSMGIAIPQKKDTTYHKVARTPDGMISFEYGDNIPTTSDFSDKVYDYVNTNMATGNGPNAPKRPQRSLLV